MIELLVVIAIIALLAAILFPVFARARENARKSSCANNLKQIAMGVVQYTQDYDESYPMAWKDTSPYYCWWQEIYPYVKNEQLYQCPSDSTKVANANFPTTPAPAGIPEGRYHVSYVINYRVCGNGTGTYNSVIGNVADMVKPSTTVLFSDGGNVADPTNEPFLTKTSKATPWLLVDPTCNNSVTKPGNCGSSTTSSNGPRSATDLNWAGPNPRHLDVANVAFLDGHVKPMRTRAWYYPDTNWLNSAVGGP